MRIPFLLGIARIFSLFVPIASFGQLNMTLQDSLTYHVGVNDVCGWAAPDGSEYALVGLNTGVSIVDIDSDSLREVVFVAGANNLWRDINTYGHYAYVSSEALTGLLIIDLQFLPDSVQTYIWKDSLPTPEGPKPFLKAHTLWVDEFGICYLNGSNLNNGGVILIDVASSPTDPIFLGYAPPVYSHDCYARDSIIYSAEIFSGNLSIYDAHDPQNIIPLGFVKTPNEFTHNAWLSDDSRYMFTTDERANSYVTSYDITDPGNIIELDRFRQAATDGLGTIPHNVYVWNDWIVVAYYSCGTLIVDGSRPDNLIEVGNFDSFLGPDGGFPGVWGSFPFLPSGKILSSDRNSGLYVFIPNYVRACFLEGTVIDSITGAAIHNALVTIESDEIVLPESTKIDGSFKTGKAIPGSYNITVIKEGYYPKTINAEFLNGEILTPLIELVSLPVYSLSGRVIDGENQGVPFAGVIMISPDGIYETTSDENGFFLFPSVYGGIYEVQAGVWGQTYETLIDMTESKDLVLRILPGYYDDFDLDLGWTVSGQVTNGAWDRGIPTEQLLFDMWLCGSDSDSPSDNGPFVYSTGISPSGNVITDEVTGGTTWLSSPPMDFTSFIRPQISFDYWLCEHPPNQYTGIGIWLTNGTDTTLLEYLRNDTIAGSWQSKLYTDLQVEAPLNEVRFMISAADTSGLDDYILKAHFDVFRLAEGAVANHDPLDGGMRIQFFPNPVNGTTLHFTFSDENLKQVTSIRILDIHGRQIAMHSIPSGARSINLDHTLSNGLYFIQWHSLHGDTGVEKIIVQR